MNATQTGTFVVVILLFLLTLFLLGTRNKFFRNRRKNDRRKGPRRKGYRKRSDMYQDISDREHKKKQGMEDRRGLKRRFDDRIS